jgi:hypothetical protein
MDSYWDFYVAYVHQCVEYNKRHDIDPHHYKMEWNHFLPRCIFGDQPIGHYLLLKQHAIATALQTLAFKKNCLCGWHKKYLPEDLLALSWSYYVKRNRENATKVMTSRHMKKDKSGRSIEGVKNAERLNSEKNEEGKSVNAVKGAKKLNEIIHAERDEFGRSVFAMKSLANTYQGEKDERGVPLARVKNGVRLHSERDEFGRSVVAMKTNNQVWESTVDGHRGNSSAVARHNRANGWDPRARIKIS